MSSSASRDLLHPPKKTRIPFISSMQSPATEKRAEGPRFAGMTLLQVRLSTIHQQKVGVRKN